MHQRFQRLVALVHPKIPGYFFIGIWGIPNMCLGFTQGFCWVNPALGTVCCARQANKSFSQTFNSVTSYTFNSVTQVRARVLPTKRLARAPSKCLHASAKHTTTCWIPDGRADQCPPRLRRSQSACVRRPLAAVRRQPTAARAHPSTNSKLGDMR